VQGSTGGLDKVASLPFSPAAAPQLTHQHAPAALGTAAQRDRNASFGESSTAVGQQLNTDLSSPFGGTLARDTQYDTEPLSNNCARPLSHQILKDSSGSASAAVTKVSKKRAAEVSCAEPEAKQFTAAEGGNAFARRRSSGRQGTTAAGGALRHVDEATAVAGGGAGCNSYAADADGDSAMADGEPKGRRRIVKLSKKNVTRAVGNQDYHGGEDIQAVARC